MAVAADFTTSLPFAVAQASVRMSSQDAEKSFRKKILSSTFVSLSGQVYLLYRARQFFCSSPCSAWSRGPKLYFQRLRQTAKPRKMRLLVDL